MSYYVKRQHSDGRIGWVGPIRSYNQSRREFAAWRDAGWDAVIHDSTPEVRAAVRAWAKAKTIR